MQLRAERTDRCEAFEEALERPGFSVSLWDSNSYLNPAEYDDGYNYVTL